MYALYGPPVQYQTPCFAKELTIGIRWKCGSKKWRPGTGSSAAFHARGGRTASKLPNIHATPTLNAALCFAMH